MIDLDELYFDWLLRQLDPDGVPEGVAYVCDLLLNCDFKRRVGLDVNRAADGANLRKAFLHEFSEIKIEPHVTNNFMMQECTWLEMLIALAQALDYLYEGTVLGRFVELVENMQLGVLMEFEPARSSLTRGYDQKLVDDVTSAIDNNEFSPDGYGGLFPLHKPIDQDQREVEIWDQHAAYFRERLEGVLWTSTR